MYKQIYSLFLITLTAPLIWFCSYPEPVQADNQNQEIKIGSLMVLTGQFAMQGAAFQEGIELAVEEINKSGGINGQTLRVIIEDTHGDPKSAHTGARKLMSVDRVIAALTMSYPDTKVGGTEFQKNKIPTIALWDSSPEIDEMGDYIFSLGPWAPSTGENSAEFAYKRLNARSAVIVNTIEEWAEYISDYFTRKFNTLGGTVSKRFPLNPDQSDFRSILAKIKRQNPDVIFAPLTHNIVPFFKQLSQNEITCKIITSAIVTKEHVLQAPQAFEGVYRSEIRDPDNEVSNNLFKLYEKKFNKPATLPWYVATGYDGVQLFSLAIKNAGPDPERIKKYLYTVKDFPGAAKKISISPGGSSPTLERIFQIRSGEFKFVDSVGD
jgi:branched-chain amino acid transport system substrate-binding protein